MDRGRGPAVRTQYTNHLMNGQFQLWDYGNGPFTTSGFTATRWKLERTGTVGVISVAPGTISSDSAVPKWWRGRTCMAVTTTSGLLTTDTGPIRQRVEEGERYAQQVVRLTVVATGTSGKSFDFGFTAGSGGDHRYARITTAGDTTVVIGTLERLMPLPSTTYWIADCFRPVSASATFNIAFAQLEYIHPGDRAAPLEVLAPDEARKRCARYVWPVGLNPAQATSTTAIATWVRAPVEMRTTPSVVKVSEPVFTDMAGTDTTASSSSIAITDASAWGGRVTATGFTGLTSGDRGAISNVGAALLEAEI